jgi:uncharacterized protein YybS (DUF2232 family)
VVSRKFLGATMTFKKILRWMFDNPIRLFCTFVIIGSLLGITCELVYLPERISQNFAKVAAAYLFSGIIVGGIYTIIRYRAGTWRK